LIRVLIVYRTIQSDQLNGRTNMSGFSASITRDVNDSVAKGRGPIGKSTRKIAYNQLIRNNQSDISAQVRRLHTKYRSADRRSRVDDPHQMRWFLEESRQAITNNLTQFRFFSDLLKRKTGKQPAQSVVVEFIVFLLGCPQHRANFGADIPSGNKKVQVTMEEDHCDEDEWGSGFRSSTACLDESKWGINQDTPNFEDEEDLV
jgi:hypothetical protein